MNILSMDLSIQKRPVLLARHIFWIQELMESRVYVRKQCRVALVSTANLFCRLTVFRDINGRLIAAIDGSTPTMIEQVGEIRNWQDQAYMYWCHTDPFV